MRDFWGNKLEVGQTVAFEEPGYRNLVRGKVVRFTPMMAVVSWRRGSAGSTQEFRARPDALIIKPEE